MSAALRDLWGHHDKKLRQVHDFLVQENYWFDTEPSDPEANRAVLGTIEAWAKGQNVLKQRGFYVDVEDGVTVSPSDGVDEQALRDLIGRVHQIGWQLRLGEHIEAKKQAELAESIPPASEELIDRVRSLFRDAMGGTFDESRLDGIRHGKPGIRLNNDEYRLRLPPLDANPFATMGKPGYEAQTRELLLLAEEIGLVSENDDDDAGEADAAPEG